MLNIIREPCIETSHENVIHSFIHQILSIYYVPGTVNKIDSACPRGTHILVQGKNQYIKLIN